MRGRDLQHRGLERGKLVDALPQRRLSLLALGDVAREPVHVSMPADNDIRRDDFHRKHRAVLAAMLRFHAHGADFPDPIEHDLPTARRRRQVDVGKMHRQELFPRVSNGVARGLVDVDEPPGPIEPERRVVSDID